ncbi:hypothetical protein [Paramesorhizobium deserti]|uniref:hypothetical protein n=1 Tax=Paramesorhizobium deserti TaxID=1494590 RepID=UPI00128FE781|nr:hypothetical protein [Paramesorhizobium deserti]
MADAEARSFGAALFLLSVFSDGHGMPNPAPKPNRIMKMLVPGSAWIAFFGKRDWPSTQEHRWNIFGLSFDFKALIVLPNENKTDTNSFQERIVRASCTTQG